MNIKDWEKEFEDKFHHTGDNVFPKRIADPMLCDELKGFISELLTQVLDEVERKRWESGLPKPTHEILIDIKKKLGLK